MPFTSVFISQLVSTPSSSHLSLEDQILLLRQKSLGRRSLRQGHLQHPLPQPPPARQALGGGRGRRGASAPALPTDPGASPLGSCTGTSSHTPRSWLSALARSRPVPTAEAKRGLRKVRRGPGGARLAPSPGAARPPGPAHPASHVPQR